MDEVTARENAAKRRERILKRQEERMKLVSGQIKSLNKIEIANEDNSSEFKLSVETSSDKKEVESDFFSKTLKKEGDAIEVAHKIQRVDVLRADPLARRQNALERRKAAESTSEKIDLVDNKEDDKSEVAIESLPYHDGFYRSKARCKVFLVIIAAVIYGIYFCPYISPIVHTDISNYAPYRDLIDQGIPIESIHEHLNRENIDLPEESFVDILDYDKPLLGKESSWIYQLYQAPPFLFVILSIRLVLLIASELIRKIRGLLPEIEIQKYENSLQNSNSFSPVTFVVSFVFGSRLTSILFGIYQEISPCVEDACLFVFILVISMALSQILFISF